VGYDENNFTMEFSLLNYRNTDNIVFQYRVNGATEWTSTAEGTNAIVVQRDQARHLYH
jgi:hypothetical protein